MPGERDYTRLMGEKTNTASCEDRDSSRTLRHPTHSIIGCNTENPHRDLNRETKQDLERE